MKLHTSGIKNTRNYSKFLYGAGDIADKIIGKITKINMKKNVFIIIF